MVEESSRPELKLFSLNGNHPLAEKISSAMGVPLGKASVKHFSDGEIQINIDESVRGSQVFVIQSVSNPVNENLMEVLIMVDALRRASAAEINVVLPYYGYSRADRKSQSREPITAKLVASLLEVDGVDRLVALDLHADQLQGFFDIPVDHFVALPIMVKYFREQGLTDDVVVVSPDHASVKGARRLAERIGATIAIVDKHGANDNHEGELSVIGDVAGKRCIISDDLIDTANRMVDSATALKAAGATEVYGCATHPIFSHRALELLDKAPIEEVIVTDSIVVPEENKIAKLKILTVGPLIGEGLKLIHDNESVSRLFEDHY